MFDKYSFPSIDHGVRLDLEQGRLEFGLYTQDTLSRHREGKHTHWRTSDGIDDCTGFVHDLQQDTPYELSSYHV